VGDPHRQYALVRRFRLLVLEGPDTGAIFESNGEHTLIGTGESASLRLHDPTVSGFHCDITLEQGRAVLRDLGSRNGTLVDGTPVIAAPLRSPAVLLLGRTRLRFDLGEDHVRIPLSEHTRFGPLVGSSEGMRAVFALLERCAPTDMTVLIEGETGTGKEVAAEALHLASARRDRPFIAIDCSAIPKSLMESELFGHEKGAFTGAEVARKGAFEAASGGTIFLDELGELPPELQPKLLRVLEEREVKPVGRHSATPIDVRVIAATNRNLRNEINQGRFRADLYFRIAVAHVRLPPLRERPNDLPQLVDHLLAELGVTGEAAERLRGPAFMEEIARHSWPGNVRELRNYLECCLVLDHPAPPGVPTQNLLPQLSFDVSEGSYKVARDRLLREFERQYLDALLRRCKGNIATAAQEAGINRSHLYRLLWKHGLK
jgi:DNA-binding NtrC family response regulator